MHVSIASCSPGIARTQPPHGDEVGHDDGSHRAQAQASLGIGYARVIVAPIEYSSLAAWSAEMGL